MYKNVDLHAKGGSAEDQMKWHVINPLHRDKYDQNLYQEAMRRVVFKNCFSHCELTDEQIPHFNKKFYYTMKEEKACLSDCINSRMVLHMGEINAKKYDMLVDFEQMKNEYHQYEAFHPQNKHYRDYAKGADETEIKDVVNFLKKKTSEHKKFDF